MMIRNDDCTIMSGSQPKPPLQTPRRTDVSRHVVDTGYGSSSARSNTSPGSTSPTVERNTIKSGSPSARSASSGHHDDDGGVPSSPCSSVVSNNTMQQHYDSKMMKNGSNGYSPSSSVGRASSVVSYEDQSWNRGGGR